MMNESKNLNQRRVGRLQSDQKSCTALAQALACLLVVVVTADVARGQIDLVCDNNECELAIDDNLAFVVALENVVDHEDPSKIQMIGRVTMKTIVSEFELAEADLLFAARETDGQVVYDLVGSALLPLSALPLMEHMGSVAPRVTLGLASRQTLRDLLETGDSVLPLAENPVPNDPSRLIEPTYVFCRIESAATMGFDLEDIMGMDLAEMGIDPDNVPGLGMPEDQSLTIILDPAEPFMFLSVDTGKDEDDESDDATDDDQDDENDDDVQLPELKGGHDAVHRFL